MNLLSKASFALLALAAVAPASAQLLNLNGSGNISVGNGTLFDNDTFSMYGSGGASSTLTPFYELNGDGRRSMIRYKASGSGVDFQLPSDRLGNTFSASNGDATVVSTWNPDVLQDPLNPHTFNASVSDGGAGSEAQIDVEVQNAPNLSFTRTGGSFITTFLDNSIYDQDAAVGSIVIDKLQTPTITIDYTLPEYDVFRDDVEWADGTRTSSLFADGANSGMWFVLYRQNNLTDIFGSPFSFDPNAARFDVGEGATTKSVAGFTGSFTFDISGVATDLYSGRYWNIPWHQAGFDDVIPGGAGGFIEQEVIETNIRVVPEPASMAALGLGLLGLARRRKSA